ncbi:hypothetical protein EYC80_009157 [Monilinia laxa]|uniref:Uncharacterized protein n=1 Tax=Monilinia laxa TaxID=61186 RepID=A0A5N6K2M4_MONLA|nr:hypothetical protein EYC80_009157 [Monilinia laxa]
MNARRKSGLKERTPIASGTSFQSNTTSTLCRPIRVENICLFHAFTGDHEMKDLLPRNCSFSQAKLWCKNSNHYFYIFSTYWMAEFEAIFDTLHVA